MSASSDRKNAAKKSHLADIPLVEWIIGAVGLLIVAGAIGVLVHEALAGDKSPPDVQLAVRMIAPRNGGYLVKVRAENVGGQPAARVGITAELVSDGKVLETREAQFDYLPAHSTREGGLFFDRDPRAGELRLRALGYEEP